MKRKILVLALVALMAVSLALTLTACGGDQGKSAYGLVHGEGYVGKATVRKNGDVITTATLDEACLPTYVHASTPSEYTVTVQVLNHGSEVTRHFYKTVKWGKVVAEYDATAKDYIINGVGMIEYFKQSEANCQTYFEAVASNEVAVVLAQEDKTIMSAVVMLKSLNNYWVASATYARGWYENVRQTCQMFVELNGNLSVSDLAQNAEKFWEAKGNTSGATWTDMKDYVGLLLAAAGK